jgi:hypothetical protein
MSTLTFNEGAAAATPATNKVSVYAKTDGKMYSKDDSGTEIAMAPLLIDSSLGAAPSERVFKIVTGPPDVLYVSMQETGSTWDWYVVQKAN